jgi:urea transporter
VAASVTVVLAQLLSAGREILRAYAQVLLSRSCWTGAAILGATLLSPRVALFGLVAVLVSSATARAWKLDRLTVEEGLFGYNALLIGLGIGQLFIGVEMALALVALASSVSVVVTAGLKSWLGRTAQLPVLSLPFLILFTLVFSLAPHLELERRVLVVEGDALAAVVPDIVGGFLRDLGAIFFLPSVEAGLLVLVGLLIHSRIATALALGAFVSVASLDLILPAPLDEHILRSISCNGMLAAVAVGGVWFVPSLAATAWAAGAVGLCVLLSLGLWTPLAGLGMSPLFVPFNLAALCVLLAGSIAQVRGLSCRLARGKPELLPHAPGALSSLPWPAPSIALPGLVDVYPISGRRAHPPGPLAARLRLRGHGRRR